MLQAGLSGMIERSTASGWMLCVIGLFGIWRLYVLAQPRMRELKQAREADLLRERASEMAAMRERLEKLEAERAVDRHRLNNVTACLDALLMLLETAPEKAAEHVKRIKELRAAQMQAEAEEKGQIMAASILRTRANGHDEETIQ